MFRLTPLPTLVKTSPGSLVCPDVTTGRGKMGNVLEREADLQKIEGLGGYFVLERLVERSSEAIDD